MWRLRPGSPSVSRSNRIKLVPVTSYPGAFREGEEANILDPHEFELVRRLTVDTPIRIPWPTGTRLAWDFSKTRFGRVFLDCPGMSHNARQGSHIGLYL